VKIFENKFLKDSSYFLITVLVTSGLGFVTIPIYTRHLSPSDYGILALFILFGSVVVNMVSVGLMSSSYRYYFEYKSDLKQFRIFNTTNAVETAIGQYPVECVEMIHKLIEEYNRWTPDNNLEDILADIGHEK
jgi:hypothetical protein